MRFFNTEGPIVPERHYSIPPLDRVDLDAILTLIQRMRYFVLHAPRQTGKTSTLLALADTLNSGGKYRCVYMNVEAGQAAREDIGAAMRDVLSEAAFRARKMLQDSSVDAIWREILQGNGPGSALKEVLARWAAADPKPLVLLIDEIDSLVGDTLISVLRQLRAGYDLRPVNFPQSVVLCGVRDVRDYRIHSTAEKAFVTGASAFNIKAKSLRLGDFTEAEVRALLAQHEAETGQAFEDGAVARVWDLTRGQPWLVNALAEQACSASQSNGESDDGRRAIDAVGIDNARETLILERVTHLDQLAEKLREDRVRRVIEPVLAGSDAPGDLPPDDLDYACDLGLVRVDGTVEIANPIYREVIPRQLTYSTERYIAHRTAWYVDAEGNLEVAKLLDAFQSYFRENSEHWVEGFGYKEAGPQLLLQAFLQRVVNGGGRLEREYGLGRRRTDLLILWPEVGRGSPARVRKHVIECKVPRRGRGPEATIRAGLEQTAEYMDRCGAASGHLVIFDRREGKSWDERLFCREETAGGKAVTVWGM